MATAKLAAKRTGLNRRFSWLGAGALLVLGIGLVALFYGSAIAGYAAAGTGYGAKNACSCRFIAGRDLNSCKSDFVPGMEAVFLSEDADARSVTAFVPLIESQTATFREGYGCVLEPAG